MERNIEQKKSALYTSIDNVLSRFPLNIKEKFENTYKTSIDHNCEGVAIYSIYELMNSHAQICDVMDNIFVLRSYAEPKGERFIVPGWEFDSGVILNKDDHFFGMFFGNDRQKEVLKGQGLADLFSKVKKQTPGPWPAPDEVSHLIKNGLEKPRISFVIDDTANNINDIWEYDVKLTKKKPSISVSVIESRMGKVTLEKEFQSYSFS